MRADDSERALVPLETIVEACEECEEEPATPQGAQS